MSNRSVNNFGKRLFLGGVSSQCQTNTGFGLHSSALTAKELGGSLTAHSDGPGKGATFVLELPLRVKEAPLTT